MITSMHKKVKNDRGDHIFRCLSCPAFTSGQRSHQDLQTPTCSGYLVRDFLDADIRALGAYRTLHG
jgi:hypothetical protein